MAKKVDPLKAKQKKQKIIAAVGAVILVAVLAYEVPSVMKHFNQKPPPGSVVGTTPVAQPPSGTPSLAAPTLAGSGQTTTSSTSAASAGGVSSGDGAPPAQDGQLASFSRFVSKDPFAQQIQTNTTPASSGGASSPTSTARGSSSTGTSGSSSGTAPAPGSAVLSVNGTLMSVTVGSDFPSTQPLFHLVSLTAHSARISIVGGSYANGVATVTLYENKPLTLMNTADGTRYRIVLKPSGTPAPNTSTTPASTTPAPTTTTTPTSSP
jgi:hypothetical protein